MNAEDNGSRLASQVQNEKLPLKVYQKHEMNDEINVATIVNLTIKFQNEGKRFANPYPPRVGR